LFPSRAKPLPARRTPRSIPRKTVRSLNPPTPRPFLFPDSTIFAHSDGMQIPTVSEAIGPDLTLGEAASAQSFGVVSLLFAGVLPALLGALGDEQRLSAAGFGWVAAL